MDLREEPEREMRKVRAPVFSGSSSLQRRDLVLFLCKRFLAGIHSDFTKREREREREKGRERERKSARPNTTRPRKNLCFLISVSLSNFYLLHQLHHRMKEGEASYGKGVSTHVCEVEITGGG